MEMATTWELVGICFADAGKAEELVRELAFRKELRVDPEKALAAFVLWRRPEAKTVTAAPQAVTAAPQAVTASRRIRTAAA
jgi:hypothetical protein